ANDNGYLEEEAERLGKFLDQKTIQKVQRFTVKNSVHETDRATYQAMEALVHNLNTMHSRAGAQIPFSSLNYGLDTSPEGRLVIEKILLATEAGLGNGETPIFPIHIFKVKEGINYNPGDPNYDLFKLACRVSAKRLFPNFSFIDAPFNLQYYVPGRPETEAAYMGCRTRVVANAYDPTRQIVNGRGNLSFTSINLPRLAIKSNGNVEFFFEQLDRMIDLVIEQLLDRFKIQCKKKVRNFPFLMGQGVWIDSDQLSEDDEIGEVLKHGTLTLGFIGLAETLKSLIGVHHGESQEAQNLGLDIVGFMRKRMDQATAKTGLNFSLIATPAEGLSGRFVRIDRQKYGTIEGVTDRDYYTNSFHVPVYFPISAYDKIRREAPYHALTNGGHISYVELDGDTTQNLEAFESVIRCMKEAGIGYGSVNHPVDRDPVCGYTGIIGDTCPRCGRHEGEGVDVEVLNKFKGVFRDYRSEEEILEENDKLCHAVKGE
ncbi:MAG: anaerobic ribonucleoside-triphosphate reductase, partial [Clostridiales bacterium]|nr:anaerobic ribonucleoside-triphosphate reductase [Clostridiales bacterium]